MIAMAPEVHALLLVFLLVVAILLSGDDDLPGPRRSFARLPVDSRPIPF